MMSTWRGEKVNKRDRKLWVIVDCALRGMAPTLKHSHPHLFTCKTSFLHTVATPLLPGINLLLIC